MRFLSTNEAVSTDAIGYEAGLRFEINFQNHQSLSLQLSGESSAEEQTHLFSVVDINGHHLLQCLQHFDAELLFLFFQQPFGVFDQSASKRLIKNCECFCLFYFHKWQPCLQLQICAHTLSASATYSAHHPHVPPMKQTNPKRRRRPTHLEMKPPLSHLRRASVVGGKSSSGRCSTSTSTDSSACTSGFSWSSSSATMSCAVRERRAHTTHTASISKSVNTKQKVF